MREGEGRAAGLSVTNGGRAKRQTDEWCEQMNTFHSHLERAATAPFTWQEVRVTPTDVSGRG